MAGAGLRLAPCSINRASGRSRASCAPPQAAPALQQSGDKARGRQGARARRKGRGTRSRQGCQFGGETLHVSPRLFRLCLSGAAPPAQVRLSRLWHGISRGARCVCVCVCMCVLCVCVCVVRRGLSRMSLRRASLLRRWRGWPRSATAPACAAHVHTAKRRERARDGCGPAAEHASERAEGEEQRVRESESGNTSPSLSLSFSVLAERDSPIVSLPPSLSLSLSLSLTLSLGRSASVPSLHASPLAERRRLFHAFFEPPVSDLCASLFLSLSSLSVRACGGRKGE